MVLDLLSSSSRHYHAADSLEERDEVVETTNFDLNESLLPNPDSILDYVQYRRPNGMPDYNLTVTSLKRGTKYMLGFG